MTRIDFHAHILPNADHGSDSVATSLTQLASAEAAGVTTVVATPHFYPDRHLIEDFLARRNDSMERLTAAYHGKLQILPGAEVLLCEGLVHLPELPQLCVAGTQVLLIEMPMVTWAHRHIHALAELRESGKFTVVLAHVDRYPPKQVEMLLAQGFLGQINGTSLCRLLGRKQLLRWIHEEKIVALGSDIHGTSNAYVKFQHACSLLGAESERLMGRTERLILPMGSVV
ncbi:MAG: CpsB/CapC family capsule biosynthesis tyrosine phosphatase [Oscillospiraceae bacterium]